MKMTDVTSYEEFYITTVHETYRHIKMLVGTYYDAKELLIRTYLQAYVKFESLPEAETDRMTWINNIVDDLAETKYNVDKEKIENSYLDTAVSALSDDQMIDETSVYLDIEERLSQLEEESNSSSKKGRVISAVQILFSVALLSAAITVMTSGIDKVKEQLEIFRQPLVKPLEDKDGNVVDAAMEKPRIVIADKVVYLYDDGSVSYSQPLIDSDLAGVHDALNPEVQKQQGWTYYLPSPDRPGSTLSDVAPFLYHKLYRMDARGEVLEIIADEVDDYTFWEDNIYISQADRVKRINVDDNFEQLASGIYPEVVNNEIYLYDTFGNGIGAELDNQITYGDRILTVSSNRVENVASAPREKGQAAYYFKDDGNGRSNEIYSRRNGQENVYLKIGQQIDSFCIAGDDLYFSAYMRKGGSGAHYSELYKKSLVNDDKPEKIHDEYSGRMLEMYYSEDNNQIYGNYIPKNWKSNHGVIAVISRSGSMSYIEDSAYRSTEETTGNDVLEFVLAYDNKIYCFWQDCVWKPGDHPVAIWRRALEIPDGNRIPIED